MFCICPPEDQGLSNQESFQKRTEESPRPCAPVAAAALARCGQRSPAASLPALHMEGHGAQGRCDPRQRRGHSAEDFWLVPVRILSQ